MQQDVTFRRINGRIVPIKKRKSDQQKTNNKTAVIAGLAAGVGTFLAFRRFKAPSTTTLKNVQKAFHQGRLKIFQDFTEKSGINPAWSFSKKKLKTNLEINAPSISIPFADKSFFEVLSNKGEKYFAKTISGKAVRRKKSAQQIQKQIFNNKPFIVKKNFEAMTNPQSIVTSQQLKNPSTFRKAKKDFKDKVIQEQIQKKNEYRVHFIGGEAFGITHRFLPGELGKKYQQVFGDGRGAFLPVLSKRKRKDLTQFTEKAFSTIGLKEGRLKKTKDVLFAGIDVIEDQKGNFKIVDINPNPGTLGNPFVYEGFRQRITGRKSVLSGLALGSKAGGVTAIAVKQGNDKNGR